MSLIEGVKQTLATNTPELEKQAEFVRLRDFYAEMEQAGLVQKQTYSLPPLDTVGRRLHQTLASNSEQ